MGKLDSILLLNLFESYICFVLLLVNFKITKKWEFEKTRQYHKYKKIWVCQSK